MKTRILFFLIFMMLFVLHAFSQVGGTTGTLTWKLNLSDSTLTISGKGAIPDYNEYALHFAPWYPGRDFIKTVMIEEGVTSIGIKAFYYCEKMTSISIPNSVTKIGDNSFAYCFKLLSITIPNQVASIGNLAFYGCKSLLSINIPNSVTSIGNSVFDYCFELTSIDVENENNNYASAEGALYDKNKTTLICCPSGKKGAFNILNNVINIGTSAFFWCTKIDSITIPNSVKSIENRAFFQCEGLISLSFPNSVTHMGNEVCSFCKSLTSVTLSNSITKISNSTFFQCENLTSIIIPSRVTSIEKEAFSGCYKLSSIIIPVSVKRFEDQSLASCYSLSLITNLNLVPAPVSSCVFVYPDPGCAFPNHLISSILKVPSSAVSAYQTTSMWNRFMIEGGGLLVSAIANNGEYGYTTGDGLYEMNSMATVTAFAYENCKFINWTKGSVVVSTENPYHFTVTEDIELKANFEYEDTGVKTFENADIHIFPNPTTGELQVTSYELQITDIEIFDIYSRNLTPQTSYLIPHTSLDISHLQTGIYFMKITTNKGITTKKIIKH